MTHRVNGWAQDRRRSGVGSGLTAEGPHTTAVVRTNETDKRREKGFLPGLPPPGGDGRLGRTALSPRRK